MNEALWGPVVDCREYLGEAGWCPKPVAIGNYCEAHAAERYSWAVKVWGE